MKNWDDLRIVLALSRHRTMTAAANSLGLNTGTVSRRLERFTEEVGKTLFVRRGTDWEPTPTAIPMINAAEKLEQNITIANLIEAAKSSNEKQLKLSIDPEILADAIAPNLSKFLNEHQNLSLDLISSDMSVALGDADLSVSFQEPVAGRLIRTKLTDIKYNSFVHNRWVGKTTGYIEYISPTRKPTNCINILKEKYGMPRIATRGLYCAVDLLKERPLVMCMPARFASRYSDLQPYSGHEACTTYPVWASFHESRRLDPDVRLALDFIRSCFV